jgi:hypothetical protein
MPSLSELQSAKTPLAAALDAGIENLSLGQTVTFTQYTKYTFSQDGYVFWVATGNRETALGSLHCITQRHQDEDETLAANNFIFSSESEVTAFNTISPTTMWIGSWTFDGAPLQIAFANRDSFYKQADVWHYRGYAVYPALSTQLVASANDLPAGPIVSNSLPIWLTQTTYLGGTVPVYPSFLVPDNIAPPYITVHIEPSDTTALGQFPIIQGTATGVGLFDFNTSQLMQDDVSLTFYGFNNQQMIQYYCMLIDYSLNTDNFGFCGAKQPAIQDEKRTQTEIAAIAMKKKLNFTASYYQSTSDAIARRLLLAATITINGA